MRTWRIHSYLSTYEDGGVEGLAQPMEADAFEDPPSSQPSSSTGDSSQQTKLKEPPSVPPKPRPDILKPRFGKPMLFESASNDFGPTKPTDQSAGIVKRLVQEKKEKERDKGTEKDADSGTREAGVDVKLKETPDIFLSKHESFRSRVNPLLQRSSRLRSSLIFSTSTAEAHTGGVDLKAATEEDEELDLVRSSSIVTQILEKRRSLSREPFEWKKKLDEKEKDKREENKEKEKEKQEKEHKLEEKETKLKNEMKAKREPEKAVNDIKVMPTVEKTEDEKRESVNLNDPANRLEYFKELSAKRKASRMATEASLKAPEPAEKKGDLSNKSKLNPVTTPNASTVSAKPAESEPKKLDISEKIAELNRRSSVSSKPPMGPSTKPPVSLLKSSDTSQSQKEENTAEGQKNYIPKSLKPLASPKIFRKEPIKIKGFHPRRSSGEEILATDATDAEKSEMKKSRSHSSSVMSREDSKEGLPKFMGSNTSLNTLGEGKPLDFFKKQTQKLKGIWGPKDKEKKSQGDGRANNPVTEITDDASKKQSSSVKDAGSSSTDQTTTNSKTSGSSRYQSPASSVLFSSNLRDDTKVILEQISANSQKNRQEQEEAVGENDSDTSEKSLERQVSLKRNKFLRPQGNTLEREGLLKRIESLRKEKKVYSRFEVVYHHRHYHT